MSQCTLFSNHGHVLLVLADDPEARLRDVAERVGITERAVQKIVRDLQDDGLLTISKHGRRNRYRIHFRKALHHPLEAHRTVGHLIAMMKGDARRASVEPEAEPPAVVPTPSARKAKPAKSPPPEPVGSADPGATKSPETPAASKPKASRRKKPDPPRGDQQGSLF